MGRTLTDEGFISRILLIFKKICRGFAHEVGSVGPHRSLKLSSRRDEAP